ncbi:hypothetical protein ELUMI_v1c08280 [Williamsoniiplasma luminosum]|uniref:Nicotinamide mononucleotide transporter n=1 Tax=Williamsoniiplasma luminosum TaxID=214888 RepID=A0A2K8NUR4_9MOLU|nr:nicotinamide riboside transporter PnuC [Williamsoniiplasma luminosum]ATZ17549.1 hypothetical protein ELUMI_v1c08280 [Williamsoniiplasma luminosum]
MTNTIQSKQKTNINFMGYQNVIKDIKELSKGFKILLLVGGIVLIFFGFFSIEVFTDPENQLPTHLKYMVGSHFSPFKQYAESFINGSPIGRHGAGIALASSILYSINGIAAFSGLLAVAMVVGGKTSQWFWGIINGILYGTFAIVAGYIGDFLGQIMIVIGAVIGWCLFTFVYKEEKFRSLKDLRQWWLKIVCLVLGLGIMIGFCFGWYYMIPVAYEGMFGLEYTKVVTSTQHFFDGVSNGVNMFAYFMQIAFITEQWWIWELTNIFKILMYSPVGLNENYVITMMIQYVVWTIISGYGLYKLEIAPLYQKIITKIKVQKQHKK